MPLSGEATRRDLTEREVAGDEYAAWSDRAVEAWPDDASYQKRTDRWIPVFVLDPWSRGRLHSVCCGRIPWMSSSSGA